MTDRKSNTQYILSLSYGKDSLACLEAIRLLGLPLDRVVTCEVYATDDINGDLPLMTEFKKKADEIILNRYGIVVEHIYAKDEDGNKLTFEKQFYKERFVKKTNSNQIYGFPMVKGQWCNSKLKMSALKHIKDNVPQGFEVIQYLGIAADEHERIQRHTKKGTILPLVEMGWDEAFCRKWCEENNLLSPIYESFARGGCWFCHNQGINQLRFLFTNYPELWQRLLQWDKDSPVTFRPDGHSVSDFDKRFKREKEGLIPSDRKFHWNMISESEEEYDRTNVSN